MHNEELVFKNLMENLAMIAIRKLDFVKIFINRLSEEIGKHEAAENTPKIIEIIGLLDPLLFLSEREIRLNQIIANTQLDELNREYIGKMISEKLQL
ncbi:MAG: hypothetical protein QXU18_14660 [Thermoplasmatales archaeon]